MNILIIGKFSVDQFGYHISDTLKDMGNSILEFDPTLKIKYSRTMIGRRLHQLNNLVANNLTNTQYFIEKRKKRIKKLISDSKIDLTISTHDFLLPDEVVLIKEKSKSPVVMWFPDSVANFGKAFFLIADYDALFFKDPYIVKVLTEQYNLKNVYYLPECCNPKFHKPLQLTQNDMNRYGCDITTYGSPHNIRSSFFIQLSQLNYSIKIWGHQPPVWLKDDKIKSLYTGEYVFNESKAKAVLAAKINLNTLHPTEIHSLNARTFEIAAIGGFQIMHWRPTILDFFVENEEIIFFNDFDELESKISFYMNETVARKKIAINARQRANNDHTYVKRLQLMIETVFENAAGYLMPKLKS